MVHEISENVSLLSPLKQLHASWGYEHVPYPYACYDDENKEFHVRKACFFVLWSVSAGAVRSCSRTGWSTCSV